MQLERTFELQFHCLLLSFLRPACPARYGCVEGIGGIAVRYHCEHVVLIECVGGCYVGDVFRYDGYGCLCQLVVVGQPHYHCIVTAVVPCVVGHHGEVAVAFILHRVCLNRHEIYAFEQSAVGLLHACSCLWREHVACRHCRVIHRFGTIYERSARDAQASPVVLNLRQRLVVAHLHGQAQLHTVALFPRAVDGDKTFFRHGLYLLAVHEQLPFGRSCVDIRVELARNKLRAGPCRDAQVHCELLFSAFWIHLQAYCLVERIFGLLVHTYLSFLQRNHGRCAGIERAVYVVVRIGVHHARNLRY